MWESTLLQWQRGWAPHWSNQSKHRREESSLRKSNIRCSKRKTTHISPPFCIFIINHLLCWPELWKRSSVRYFFKRSFLCFLNVCAPFFVFVRKKEGKKSNPDSLARRERLVRVTAGGRVKRMLFLPQNRHKCFHL